MALDGSLDDKLSGESPERLLRPASYDYAVTAFPQFILLLKRNGLTLHFTWSAGSVEVVTAIQAVAAGRRWVMLRPDFDICKDISKKVRRLWPGEPDDSYLERIRGFVKVAFAGRGVPT